MEATNTLQGPKEQMPVKDPVLAPGHTLTTITRDLTDIVLEKRAPRGWYVGFTICFMLLMLLFASITWLFWQGTGIWGLNIPVGWGFAIINFVWWIGIGHAGTLISAILCLLRQDWRCSINRFAEAMTVFAVMCAGIFPLIHVGRPWLAYWLLPYPNTMALWPQFRSPLLWDVFAVSIYGTVSLLFWYTGLVPDIATLRDRGIGVNVHYIPVHLHPFYRERFGTGRGLAPVAEEAYDHMLSLPMFPALSDEQVERVVDTVDEVVEELS